MRKLTISLSSSYRPPVELASVPFLSSYWSSNPRLAQSRQSVINCSRSSNATGAAGSLSSGGHLQTQCLNRQIRQFSATVWNKVPPHSRLAEASVNQLPETSQVLVDGTGNEPQGPGSGKDHRPPTERMLKLGKTIRTLHERLPTLLVNPIPPEILSPQITLRLFPSTHPHLPVVSGRIAYTAALWTSPVAWGRVPVVGNVRLEILSERMVRNDSSGSSQGGDEKLIVRWKTGRSAATTNGGSSMTDMIRKMLNVLGDDSDASATPHQDGDFHGLFLFEFDDEGRILAHTIEHMEQGNIWEKTAKVISVTDWLLGKGWRKETPGLPKLAFCGAEEHESGKKKDRSKC